MNDDELRAEVAAELDEILKAFDQALDLLEEVVRTHWIRNGPGRFKAPSVSYADEIVDLLVVHRPGRWERTTGGLYWHPEIEPEGFAPFEHRGEGGADVV